MLVAILGLSFSCSTYMSYLEKQDALSVELKKIKEQPLYCEAKAAQKDYNIVHEAESGKEEFTKIIHTIKSQQYSISELGLIYTLYNTFVRPDATNWNGRIQFYIQQNNKKFYFDFNDETGNLNKAIKTFKHFKISSFSTHQLINIATKSFPKKLTVQKKFSTYLEENKGKLSSAHIKKFFRLNKPLQKGETFRANPRSYRTSSNIKYAQDQTPLFPNTQNKLSQCNFDSKLYESGIFIIHDGKLNENVFSIMAPNGDFIMIASSSGELKKAKHELGQSDVRVPKFNTPLCTYIDNQKEIISLAYQSRDAGQLLFHLNQYQYFNSNSIKELIEYTSYARHLFLTNPPRMLYESKRGTPKELNHFLSLNFPVYHAKDIGLVHSISNFDLSKDKHRFVQDDRADTHQSCIN